MTLAEWLTAPDNPFFARSFVNRVWGHYFGVGLVNPVDDFSLANPPTNARLLDALAEDFVEHGYDIRKLERTILVSRTYQLGYETNATNKFDKNNYSHAYVRPLMAEEVVDVLNAALGVDETFAGQDDGPGGHEDGRGRVEPAANREPGLRPPHLRPAAADHRLRLRAGDGAGPAADALPHDRPGAAAKFTDTNGRVAQAAAKSKLTRRGARRGAVPGDAARAADGRREGRRRRSTWTRRRTAQTAFTDVLWALMNTREFILNH